MSDDLSIPNPGYRGTRAGRYGTGSGRAPQRMDTDTRRLVMFAGGLGAVLVVLIGASALMGRHSGEVPVVSADPRPVREKPANPGGMKIDGAENDVFSGGSDTENAKLAPAPEVPDSAALRAAPSLAQEEAPAPAMPSTAARSATSPLAAAPPPPPVAAAAPAVPRAPAPVSKSLVTIDAPLAPKPTPMKLASAAPVAEARSVSASGHQPMVQLAALTSEESARAEWAQLTKKMPDLLSGRQPIYTKTERDGHTFWRVRTSGFADVGQARGFCERVRAKGAGCSVADF